MSVLDRHEPSAAELRWFGVLLAAFAAVVGALVLYGAASFIAAAVIWVAGAVLAAIYYILPPTRYFLFSLWMAVFFPLGWLISHLLMALVYYLLISPVALVMKLTGRDALRRKRNSDNRTYWTQFEEKPDHSRYFQQF